MTPYYNRILCVRRYLSVSLCEWHLLWRGRRQLYLTAFWLPVYLLERLSTALPRRFLRQWLQVCRLPRRLHLLWWLKRLQLGRVALLLASELVLQVESKPRPKVYLQLAPAIVLRCLWLLLA